MYYHKEIQVEIISGNKIKARDGCRVSSTLISDPWEPKIEYLIKKVR